MRHTESPFLRIYDKGEWGSLDSLEPQRVKSDLLTWGCTVFRGFGASSDEFVAFTSSIGSTDVAHTGVRRNVSPHLQDVTADCVEVDAHIEMGRSPASPDLVSFFCSRPATRGGESTVYDGAAMTARLPDEIRDALEPGIAYQARLDPEMLCQMLGLSDRELLPSHLSLIQARFPEVEFEALPEYHYLGRYKVSAFVAHKHLPIVSFASSILGPYGGDHWMRPEPAFADGRPMDRGFLSTLRRFYHAFRVEIALGTGDFILIDNTRVMHGRNSFEGGAVRQVYARLMNL